MKRKFELDYQEVLSALSELDIDEGTLNWHLCNGIHDSMWDGQMVMLDSLKPPQKWALDFLVTHGMIFFLNDRYYTTPYGWYAYEEMNRITGEQWKRLGKEIRRKRLIHFILHPIDSLKDYVQRKRDNN